MSVWTVHQTEPTVTRYRKSESVMDTLVSAYTLKCLCNRRRQLIKLIKSTSSLVPLVTAVLSCIMFREDRRRRGDFCLRRTLTYVRHRSSGWGHVGKPRFMTTKMKRPRSELKKLILSDWCCSHCPEKPDLTQIWAKKLDLGPIWHVVWA